MTGKSEGGIAVTDSNEIDLNSRYLPLSVVIPAHNEEGCLESTVRALHTALAQARVAHEIVIVNDGSTDQTAEISARLASEIPSVVGVNNEAPHGFGYAVRKGLDTFSGETVAIYMADASDRPEDLLRYFRAMERERVDCVFGTRFHPESRIVDYPKLKLSLNRLANFFIRILFGIPYNDVTNAFKLYGKNVVDGTRPFLSAHFNLTVELPLKAIIRGYTYTVVPNDWVNRQTGVSKLKIKEMGSRYLFIVLYCFLERWLSQGDYRQPRKLLHAQG